MGYTADFVNTFIHTPAQSKQMAKVIAAHAHIQNLVALGVEQGLELPQTGGALVWLGSIRTFQNRHQVNRLVLPPVDARNRAQIIGRILHRAFGRNKPG